MDDPSEPCTCVTDPEHRRFGENPECPIHGYEAVIRDLRQQLARAVEALRDIAKVDHIDAVLDPTRPLRIARAWLREHNTSYGGQ